MRTPTVALAVCLTFASTAGAQGIAARPAGEWARAFDRGDYPGAIALAKEQLKTRPHDLQAQIVLARGLAALGRFDAAYEGFREALRIDPRSTDALYYLGITAGVLAQGEYERLFALAPGSARAHQLQGESYEAQSRTAEAETEYKQALAANPRSVELLVALGDLTRRNAEYDDAVSYYSRAAALAPGSYDVLYGLGAAHSHRQEYTQAIEYLRQALHRDPSSASAHFALGSSLLQTGQTQAAVVELEAAAAREPRMRQAYYLLGRAYTALGRTQAGEAAFARFQELASVEAPDPR
jgi:tetratricopeptide (TPR) repeat protein